MSACEAMVVAAVASATAGSPRSNADSRRASDTTPSKPSSHALANTIAPSAVKPSLNRQNVVDARDEP